MTARKPDKTTYPDPATLIGQRAAAGIIGCSVDTLSKRIRDVGSRSPKQHVEAVAALFRRMGGTKAMPPAAMVYDAAGIDLETLRRYGVEIDPCQPAPEKPEGSKKSKRWRPTKENLAPLEAMPDARLRGELDAALGVATGKAPGMTMAAAIVKILLDRGYPLQGNFKGIPLARLRADSLIRFGDVGTWMAEGGSEPWPFIIPDGGGRPVDILSATEEQIASGTFAELDLRGLLDALSSTLSIERVTRERPEVAGATGESNRTIGDGRV